MVTSKYTGWQLHNRGQYNTWRMWQMPEEWGRSKRDIISPAANTALNRQGKGGPRFAWRVIRFQSGVVEHLCLYEPKEAMTPLPYAHPDYEQWKGVRRLPC